MPSHLARHRRRLRGPGAGPGVSSLRSRGRSSRRGPSSSAARTPMSPLRCSGPQRRWHDFYPDFHGVRLQADRQRTSRLTVGSQQARPDRGERHPGRCGRMPNTASIGLEKAGIGWTSGLARVNERLRETAPDVWAIGECAGSPNSPMSRSTTFASSATTWQGDAEDPRPAGAVLHVHRPAAGPVGLSESGSARPGMEMRVAKLPMSAVLRSEATHERKDS